MTDTNPTPGPWMISELNSSGNVSPHYIFIEPGVAVIERKVDPVHDMADARLIAAAPDLLAALRDLLVGAEAMGWPTAQARAAISRAEGGAMTLREEQLAGPESAVRIALGAIADHLEAATGAPGEHVPTDGERDLAALCSRLVRRLREVSPDDKLAATATDYLNRRRYLNPLRIKALADVAATSTEPGSPQ